MRSLTMAYLPYIMSAHVCLHYQARYDKDQAFDNDVHGHTKYLTFSRILIDSFEYLFSVIPLGEKLIFEIWNL